LLPFLVGQGFQLGQIFDEVLAHAMGRIGSLYIDQQLTIGDEHRMTHSVRDALLSVRRSLSVETADGNTHPKAIVGCMRGQMHEIGAIMIRLLLIQAGWDVIYLGQDVPTEEFHSQAVKHAADLICISVALPRGEAEANDAISLLSTLSSDRKGPGFKLVVGGPMLPDEPSVESNGSISEVRFFKRSRAFQDWLGNL
jgi:methanogenic corrinoid protein MtbC1